MPDRRALSVDGGKGWAAFKAYGRSILLHPARVFGNFIACCMRWQLLLDGACKNVVERRRKMNTIKQK
jgi:hypothetical protein